MEKKFKFYSEELGMSEVYSMNDLKSSIIRNCYAYDKCFQYLGYKAGDRELFEGDIIELTITDEQMDVHGTGIAHSSIGKYVSESIEEGNPITSIICAIRPENSNLTTGYDIYCLRNGKIERNKRGELEPDTSSYNDGYFPQYLTNKGAKYIGNIVENPDILQNKGELWDIKADKFLISFGSINDIIIFSEAINPKNFESPYGDCIEAYPNGYIHCLVDMSQFKFQLVDWRHIGDYPLFYFENFRYSSNWREVITKNK